MSKEIEVTIEVKALCQQIKDRATRTYCLKSARKQDRHKRWLCDDCYDEWNRRVRRNLQRLRSQGQIGESDIRSLDNLIRMLENNSGTVEDLAREMNGCRGLLNKLRGKIHAEIHP